MEKLFTKPSVLIVEDKYAILLMTEHNGLFVVRINGVNYYENNAGCLNTLKNHAIIYVPQDLLNESKEYEVLFFRSHERTKKGAQMDKPYVESFKFKPLLKTNDINIYHLADVHGLYEDAVKCSKYLKEPDLFIVNGDLSDSMSEVNFKDQYRFLGNLSNGYYPIIFTRGNHDTRGYLSEKYGEYYPSVNGYFFYKVKMGLFNGLVLDLGEDKDDSHIEYGGIDYLDKHFSTNDFHGYRLKELEYLESLKKENYKCSFVISHSCFIQTHPERGSIFDIEEELYKKYVKVLEDLGCKICLHGHDHRAFVINPHSNEQYIDSSMYSVMASIKKDSLLCGSYINILDNHINITLNDKELNLVKEIKIDL